MPMSRVTAVKALAIFCALTFLPLPQTFANPYLSKPGEVPIRLRIATCAVSGGFVHLYGAIENNLFEKYGFKLEHVYIRSTGPSLAALLADEIQFLYCAADATIPSLAGGIDAKIVAAPLVKMPFVLVTQKDIRRLEDLKGKALGIVRPGDLSDRLSRLLVKRFNIPDVTMRPIGGSQSERYQAMVANLVQGVVISPPIDVRAKNDGYNVVYRLIDMDLPFVYSSVHASARFIRERPEVVQRMVAAFAEAVQFADKNPAKTKAAMAKVMRIKDEEALNASYNVYGKDIVDRRMTVPGQAVAEAVELIRGLGLPVKRKAEELYDNSFVNHLERSGFQKELWGK
jgi:ABC-type nitrate/sulfonate/bicarbonate transport system substrate-binding protein